jgi:hypothetical protein
VDWSSDGRHIALSEFFVVPNIHVVELLP